MGTVRRERWLAGIGCWLPAMLWLAVIPAAAVAGVPGRVSADEATAELTGASSLAVADRRFEPARPEAGASEGRWPMTADYGSGEWGGLRARLAAQGLTIEPVIIVDTSDVFSGGARHGGAFRYLIDLTFGLNMRDFAGWSTGRLVLNLQRLRGQSGSQLAGDFQGFSNIDFRNFDQVNAYYYEFCLGQRGGDYDSCHAGAPANVTGHLFQFTLGKLDANAKFAYAENAAEFIQSSMGFSPTILGFPSYPDPAMGVIGFVYPSDRLYAGFGMFDGSTQDPAFRRSGNRGPGNFFSTPSDYFYVGEAGGRWSTFGGGRIGIGLWHHGGKFDRFDGGVAHGTTGAYLTADQTLWTETEGRGIGAFLQLGIADTAVADVDFHVGTGLIWIGALSGRDEDQIGVGPSYVHLSDKAKQAGVYSEDYELSLSIFYKFQATPWLSIKPDLQYIRHPGGNGLDDAVVGTVRVEALF